ncbi:MAG: CinA family nicotinamide mononucleotide deamidase-related protein [Gemmatimonadales bacterium]|nr:MAG: CinA family nicotinamide mononucleotide deamidase-related protein [Gemmatimonadales bacterium]
MSTPNRPSAVILTIGDELLVGDRTDTNASWLAAFLTNRGFEVERILSVGDAPTGIREGLRSAFEWSGGHGLVVATGGLGPTEDDRTREVVADLFGAPLDTDSDVLDALQRRFRSRGMDRLPEPNHRIALVPRGAEVLWNDVGSAPGLALEGSEGRLVLLPGVPSEMKHLATERMGAVLDQWFGPRPPQSVRRIVQTTGIPESALAERLESRLPSGSEVNLAYRPSVRGVELVFSSTGPEAEGRLTDALQRVDSILEAYRYESSSGDLAESVLDALRERGWRIALAESCTGGMLAARLTDVPGSSDVVQGGIVAYSDRAKVTLLDVEAERIEREGSVSAGVAEAMAAGVARRFEADVGVGITGVAGPGGGSPEKPIGTVWFGFRTPDREWVEQLHLPGDRGEVRVRAVQHALHRVLTNANSIHGRG